MRKRQRKPKTPTHCRKHFRNRIFQRYGIDLDIAQIKKLEEEFRQGKYIVASKQSKTKTKTRVLLDIYGRVVIAIYTKKLNCFVTALPPGTT